MPDQLMSPKDAERAVWGFYWQLDNSRDRRSAPVNVEPGSAEHRQIERDKQSFLGSLWEGVQKQVDRFYTTKKRQEFLDAEAERAKAEVEARNKSAPGQVDHRTGLPVSANELASGRGVISGIDLCLEVIVPPDQLAASCTLWLPPCPLDWKQEHWEDEDSNWQALAYKPKSEWTQDEADTVKANGLQIKKVIHRLADEHGLFQLRPLNADDPELSDIVWEDRAGFTLGFKLNYKGYKYMQEFCDKDPELKRSIHMLTYAGRELREQAPEWAQREYQQANG